MLAVINVRRLKQESFWLPPRDSNPDTLLQRQVSYR